MPRKSNSAGKKSQAGRGNARTALNSVVLRQLDFEIDQAIGSLAMEGTDPKEIRRLEREYLRLKSEIERVQFQQVTRLGFYTPRAPSGEPLTLGEFSVAGLSRHQRYRFNKAATRARKAVENNRFSLLPARMSKAARSELTEQARDIGALLTPRAVFLPVNEGSGVVPAGRKNRGRGPAKLVREKHAKAWTLEEKTRLRDGTEVKERYFLAGSEYVAQTTERLDDLWGRQKFNPRTQRVRVMYRGRAVGTKTYRNLDAMLQDLAKYSPELQARIFSSMQVLITTAKGVPLRLINPQTGKSRQASASVVKRVAELDAQHAARRRKRRTKPRK
jgi:hypothetical protein